MFNGYFFVPAILDVTTKMIVFSTWTKRHLHITIVLIY